MKASEQVSKCKRRVRECLLQPNITSDIKEMIRKCGEFSKLSPSKPSESLQTHYIPSTLWTQVGSDLFGYDGQQYIIISDYYIKCG